MDAPDSTVTTKHALFTIRCPSHIKSARGGWPRRRVLRRRGGPRGQREHRHRERPLAVADEESVPGTPYGGPQRCVSVLDLQLVVEDAGQAQGEDQRCFGLPFRLFISSA
jgi:hypothetical protein